MPFVKGHKLAKGRPVGTKNHPDVSTLKQLLSESFNENRVWVKGMISNMLMDCRKHLSVLNERIAACNEDEKEYTANLRFLVTTRSCLLEDFKWLLTLKASLEPKEVKGDLQVTHSVEGLLSRIDYAERQGNVVPSKN